MILQPQKITKQIQDELDWYILLWLCLYRDEVNKCDSHFINWFKFFNSSLSGLTHTLVKINSHAFTVYWFWCTLLNKCMWASVIEKHKYLRNLSYLKCYCHLFGIQLNYLYSFLSPTCSTSLKKSEPNQVSNSTIKTEHSLWTLWASDEKMIKCFTHFSKTVNV